MNTPEIEDRTQQVVHVLESLHVNDALTVLYNAFGVVINENINASYSDKSQLIYPVNPNLIRRPRGGISKIDRDPEIKAFIHSLPMYLTVIQISEECKKKFGEKRAPSKSAVYRYIKGLSKPNTEQEAGSNNG